MKAPFITLHNVCGVIYVKADNIFTISPSKDGNGHNAVIHMGGVDSNHRIHVIETPETIISMC